MTTQPEKVFTVDGFQITAAETVMSITAMQDNSPDMQRKYIEVLDRLFTDAVGPQGPSNPIKPLRVLDDAAGKLRALGHDVLTDEILKASGAFEVYALAATTTRRKLRERIATLHIVTLLLATTCVGLGGWVYALLP